jgi:hypothetical protein
VRLERESRERTVDSNGRVTELEDDAMLPPRGAETGAARGRVDAAPFRDTDAQNGPTSGYAREPVGQSEMHERHR